MTDDQIENVWRQFCLPVYNKNPRNRLYAITPESKRQLVAVFRACRDSSDTADQAQQLFGWALEQFTDCGVNVLQPREPAELQPPQMWTDLWGNPLPNPFNKTASDMKAQTLLVQRDPVLATWQKKFAADPYGAATEWQDQCWNVQLPHTNCCVRTCHDFLLNISSIEYRH